MNSALIDFIYWSLIDDHGFDRHTAQHAAGTIAAKLPDGLDTDYDSLRIEDAINDYVYN